MHTTVDELLGAVFSNQFATKWYKESLRANREFHTIRPQTLAMCMMTEPVTTSDLTDY
jgi:hypothetical protein